jgi:serine/threonine-protein kinase
VFFSPDGQWIGFYSTRERRLKKVAIAGGPAVTICDTPGMNGASWGDDDTIVFSRALSPTGGLFRVSANGGEPERLTTPDRANGELDHLRPEMLPGSRGVLFTILTGFDLRQARVAVLDLATRQWRVLVQGGSSPRYAASGHLLYGHLGTLMAVGFDAQRLETTGNPVPVQEGIVTKGGAVANFGISDTGTLVYAPGGAAAVQGRPVWVARDGREVAPLVDSDLDLPQFPRLSPDGRRLALNGAGDLWVYDLEGRPPIKLTFDGSDFAVMWSPDGRRLVYEGASGALQSIPADGSSRTPEKVSPDGHYHPHGWSSDGRELIAVEIGAPTLADLIGLPVGGTGTRRAIVQTDNTEGQQGAALSPDGRSLAYVSDITGQAEVWVQPYPGPGAPVRVSPGGGVEPVWARNGRELFYLQGDRLMAVVIASQASFSFSPPTQLFEGRYRRGGQPPSYDVAQDGRFLMLKSPDAQAITAHFVVVLNWFEELRRRVPTN